MDMNSKRWQKLENIQAKIEKRFQLVDANYLTLDRETLEFLFELIRDQAQVIECRDHEIKNLSGKSNVIVYENT